MICLRTFWLRFLALFRKRKLDAEITEELCSHLEMQTQENLEAGTAPEAARRSALRWVASTKGTCRDQQASMWLEQFLQDLRYGLRVLRKGPGFAAIIVLTLGLAIGATTAIFTLLDYMVMRSLPVRKAQELMVVAEPDQFSYPAYQRLRDLNNFCTEMIGVSTLPEMLFSLPEQAEASAKGSLVSGNYFAALGVNPFLGRTILPADDRVAESSPVAVISYDFWQRAFNGSRDVLGQNIRVRSNPGYAATSGLDIYDGAGTRSREGAVLTIVGVTPPGFFGHVIGASTDVWIPLTMQPAVMPGRPWLDKSNVRWVNIMGRLKPDVTQRQAGLAMTLLWRQLRTDAAGATLTTEQKREIAQEVLKVESGGKGFGWFRNQFVQPLRILMTVVSLVLLIACLNVANLLMARGNIRQREIGVRLALGSGRVRLIRQLLTESLLLGVMGGLLGVLIAFVGTKILLALASSGYQAIYLQARPDFRTLGFTAAVTLLATLLFGLAPALRAADVRLGETLKDAPRGTMNRQGNQAAKSLVAIQVATSMALLIGGGLLVRTLHNLRTQDVGYNPDHLMMLRLDPVSAGYRGDGIGRVCKNILDRIAALPGVRSATFSENGLFYGPESQTRIEVEGFVPGSVADQRARFDQAGPGYFSSLGIPLLLGRDFTERDGPTAPRVAVINETFAKFVFPKANPIGKHIVTRVGDHRLESEIVGVSRDVQDHSFWSERVRRFYVSYFQPIDGITEANFAIRTVGNPANFEAMLRHEVRIVDPGLMILSILDLHSLMDRSLEQTRLLADVSAFFGLLAAALAAIGLYGVMSYDVARRTKEIGIRTALGARRRDVLGLFLRNGLKLTALGLALGTGVALALARLLRAFLFGVEPTDPGTCVGVAILFAAVALLACFIPARRATNVDPMQALRHE